MRLIRVVDLELEEFYDEAIPPYAILSHTWESGEVTLQSFQAMRTGLLQETAGFRRVQSFCRILAQAGVYEYAWVDTACINKESSADLSEAINSMYLWYESSGVCFVYLCDISATSATSGLWWRNQLRQCRWFHRGWTLQELIAPRHVRFFDSDWTELHNSIATPTLFSQITGRPASVLAGQYPPHSCSIAQRMSWAARRQTTRIEDMAYSLLGLFDVNMPLLYGEGPKAFERLQRKILKKTTDASILCWQSQSFAPLRGFHSMVDPSSCEVSSGAVSGILAPSVHAFAQAGDIARCSGLTIADRGLLLDAVLIIDGRAGNVHVAVLRSKRTTGEQFGIYLYRDPDLYRDSTAMEYARVMPTKLWRGWNAESQGVLHRLSISTVSIAPPLLHLPCEGKDNRVLFAEIWSNARILRKDPWYCEDYNSTVVYDTGQVRAIFHFPLRHDSMFLGALLLHTPTKPRRSVFLLLSQSWTSQDLLYCVLYCRYPISQEPITDPRKQDAISKILVDEWYEQHNSPDIWMPMTSELCADVGISIEMSNAHKQSTTAVQSAFKLTLVQIAATVPPGIMNTW